MIESSNDPALPDVKGLYVCAVLGHLATTNSSAQLLQFTTNIRGTAQACDVLLRCLVNSFRKRLFISPKCSELLEAIAPMLVENSSSPGWLTLAANFLPLFGMKNIAEMKIVKQSKYENANYMRLCQLVLSHDCLDIKNASKEERPFYSLFLKRILKLAPDEGTLFEIFAIKEIKRFFFHQQDQDKFCLEFYKENVFTTWGDDIREKLQRLINLPRNLRYQLSGVLYSYLSEFIQSVEMPTNKDVQNFIEIQLSLKLNSDQIHMMLMLLSTSETVVYQELLLKLLSNDQFGTQWDKVKRATKSQICTTWIKTRECPKDVSKTKVARVYQVAEELISCTLVNNALRKKLLEFVRDWLLQNVQPEIIFQELKDLDTFRLLDVRDSCIHLIGDILDNHLPIINEKRLLSQFSHSR